MPSNRPKFGRPKGADFHKGSKRINDRKDAGIEDEDYYDDCLDDDYDDENGDDLTDAPSSRMAKGKESAETAIESDPKRDPKAEQADAVIVGSGDVKSEVKKSAKKPDKSQGKRVDDSGGDYAGFLPTSATTTRQGEPSNKEPVNPWGWDGDGGKKQGEQSNKKPVNPWGWDGDGGKNQG